MAKQTVSPEREKRLISQLDERFERVNRLWKQAEKKLKRFSIPQDVSVIYHSDMLTPCGNVCGYLHLGYTKFKGEWRICHGSSVDAQQPDEDESISWKPIVDCCADVRLEAIDGLAKLKDAVLKVAEESVARLDEGIAQLESVLNTI